MKTRHRVHASRRRARGFSLIELLIVVSVIVIISGLALPSMTGVLTTARVRGGMSDISGLYQRCRSQAVKTNQIMSVQFTTSGSNAVAYVDNAVTPQGLVTSTPQLYLPRGFSQVGEPSGLSGAPPAMTVGDMWGGGSGAKPSTNDTYFNALGVPCTYNAGACNPVGSSGFISYFKYTDTSGVSWTAVGVSPGGRIKTWYWTGTAWGN